MLDKTNQNYSSTGLSFRAKMFLGMGSVSLMLILITVVMLLTLHKTKIKNQDIVAESQNVYQNLSHISGSINDSILEQNDAYSNLLAGQNTLLTNQINSQRALFQKIIAMEKSLAEVQEGTALMVIDGIQYAEISHLVENYRNISTNFFKLDEVLEIDEKVVKKASRAVRAYIGLLDDIKTSEEEGEAFGKIMDLVSEARPTGVAVKKRVAVILSQIVENNLHSIEKTTKSLGVELSTIAGESKERLDGIIEKQDQIKSLVKSNTTKLNINTKNIAQKGKYLTAVSALAVLIAILFSLKIIWSVTRPIEQSIGNFSHAAEKLSLLAGQLSESSSALADGASHQNASLEETGRFLSEMDTSTHKNAEHTQKADTVVKSTKKVLEQANSSMGSLTQSMEEISNSSQETSNIVQTIDEIAFQTNLLALNAAVEAARAGEAGAGFAVVADEVRNLAMRATEGAKNTAQLIDKTVEKINEGSTIVSQTSDAFNQAVNSFVEIDQLIDEIALSSNGQTTEINKVNTAVSSIEKITQQNSTMASESATASNEMSEQTYEMQKDVTILSNLIYGKS